MTDLEWQSLIHLKESMNWGDPARMNREFLWELERFVDFLKTDIFISCGTNKTHLENSQHDQGLAVDILFPGSELSELFDIYQDASRFKFTGIGVYPHWKYEGKQIGGLHLDFRTTKYRALWMGVEEDGKQQYIALTSSNLKKYGLI